MSSRPPRKQRLCSFLACTSTLSHQHCDHVHTADSRPVCGNRNICPGFCSRTLYTQLMSMSFGDDDFDKDSFVLWTPGSTFCKHIIQMWPVIWITLLWQDWIIMFSLLLRNVCVILLQAEKYHLNKCRQNSDFFSNSCNLKGYRCSAQAAGWMVVL